MTTASATDRQSRRAPSSRQRYRAFAEGYRHGRLDDVDGRGPRGGAGSDAPRTGSFAAFTHGKRRQYLRDYLRWLWPHRWGLLFVFALSVVVAIAEIMEPLFMRFMIDRVLLNPALDPAARLSRLHAAGALFVVVILFTSQARVFKDYRQYVLNARITLSLRRSAFERLLHLPISTLRDMKTGGILSRLTGDVETTSGLLQLALMAPTLAVLRLGIALAVLVTLNWRLALTALALIPGAMLMSAAFARRVRPIYRSVRQDAERIDGRVGETFSGIRVVRSFRREQRERFDYLLGRHTVLRKELFARRRDLVVWTLWGVLLASVNVTIVWYGGYLNLSGRATIGDIMAFQWYTFLLMSPVQALVQSLSELQRSLAAMERVFDVLAMETDKPDRPDARDAPHTVREIAFEDVEFEYRADHPVVRDFSLVVPGGSVVALVGRSGAGKTTVTDLVARFHDPTRGRIRLNGCDIKDFRVASYRKLLAIVQQDVFLFDGSVRDNIAYGRRDATAAEIEDAARRANAHEFIVRLPEQYDTFIGERGVKLSGGQCQRLAIARAFLASPQILILDEATSNLDTESEQLIQASMAALLAGRTTFVIAHRLSTIRRADLILLMDDGRIVERGTHDELMRARAGYHRMVRRQVDASVEDVEQAWCT